MRRHVLLVGLPGSGKSTVGQLVADGLEAPLLDIDLILVRQMGMPIAQIFGMVGEPRFRAMERDAVDTAQSGIERARELGVERTSGSILTQNMVEPLIELGQIDLAEQLLARDLVVRTFRIFRVYTTASRIRALVWRGRIDEATSLLEEWRPVMHTAAIIERL